MSVSASLPSVPAASGQAHGLGAAAGKPGAAAGAVAGFDALMAAFFGQAGQPGAAAGALPIATEASALGGQAAGKSAGKGDADAQAEGDADAQTGTAAAMDPNLALLALVSPVLPPQVQITTGSPGATGEASGPSGQATPAPTPAQTLDLAQASGQDAGALLTPSQVKPQAPAGQAEPGQAVQAKTAEPPKVASAPKPVEPPPPASQRDAAAALAAEQLAAQTDPNAEVAATEAAAATPTTPSASAGAKPAAKPARAEKAAASSTPVPNAAAPAARTGGAESTPTAEQAAADGKSDEAALAPGAATAEAKSNKTEPATGQADFNTTLAQTRDSAATPTHTASVRGSPETVAHLAAQIVKKLDSRSTRFDLELNPAGLGRVDVRIEIGAQGQVAAALSCDNPQAAAELKARAAELQRTLEQAGFDLSGGLSFDLAADQGGSGRGAWTPPENDSGRSFHGRAFQSALDTAGAADTAAKTIILTRASASGVDVRI